MTTAREQHRSVWRTVAGAASAVGMLALVAVAGVLDDVMDR